MAYTPGPVVKIANQELGYLEKETNSQLYSKTANAGDENYTKYAKELYEAGYYNGNKNGYAWCDVCVDWFFYKAFGKDIGQKLQCQTGDLGAGCKYSAQYYKKAGRYYKTPKIGDQIFFKNASGSICHTGLVVDVTSTKVFTIEGNTSSAAGVVANGGAVAKKSYNLTYNRIDGYGRPRYDKYDVTATVDLGGVCNVELPVLKNGAKSASVKALQTLLIGYGYSCGTLGADGSFGTNTAKAVKAYQEDKRLSVDGVVGRNTWLTLLGGK